MRNLLVGVCLFTILGSCWLAVMSIVLHHPGYEAQLGLALLFAVQSLVTLGVLAGLLPGVLIRFAVAVGTVGIAAAGGRAVALNLSSPHFEGYAILIGGALVLQALLTIWTVYVKRPPMLSRTAPICRST